MDDSAISDLENSWVSSCLHKKSWGGLSARGRSFQTLGVELVGRGRRCTSLSSKPAVFRSQFKCLTNSDTKSLNNIRRNRKGENRSHQSLIPRSELHSRPDWIFTVGTENVSHQRSFQLLKLMHWNLDLKRRTYFRSLTAGEVKTNN